MVTLLNFIIMITLRKRKDNKNEASQYQEDTLISSGLNCQFTYIFLD